MTGWSLGARLALRTRRPLGTRATVGSRLTLALRALGRLLLRAPLGTLRYWRPINRAGATPSTPATAAAG